MGKVLEAIGDSGDAIAEIDFTGVSDVYYQVKVAFPSAALIAARPANENYGPNFCQAKNALIPDGWGAYLDPINATDIYFDSTYAEFPPNFFGPLVAGTYYTLDFRIVTNGSNQQTFYTKVNGTLYVNGEFNSNIFGQVVGCQFGQLFVANDPDQIAYIDDIKIGTTGYGSTDIFSEDFEGATPLANFTSTTGTLSVVTDPFGAGPVDYTDTETIILSLTPSGVDEPTGFDSATERVALTPSSSDVAAYVDSGTELFHFTPSGVDIYPYKDVGTELFKLTPSADEHYCPQKVEFEGFLQSRWYAERRSRWAASEQGRWIGQFLGVGEGFAC